VGERRQVARKGLPREAFDPAHGWIIFTSERSIPHPTARSELKYLVAPKGFVPKLRTNDWFLLRELVQSGLGVGVLPSFFAASLERAGALVRVLPTSVPPVVKIYCVTPRRKMPRRVEVFRDYLLQTVARGSLSRRA
jgi:DNA-binding transcriptional LysR family regulator